MRRAFIRRVSGFRRSPGLFATGRREPAVSSLLRATGYGLRGIIARPRVAAHARAGMCPPTRQSTVHARTGHAFGSHPFIRRAFIRRIHHAHSGQARGTIEGVVPVPRFPPPVRFSVDAEHDASPPLNRRARLTRLRPLGGNRPPRRLSPRRRVIATPPPHRHAAASPPAVVLLTPRPAIRRPPRRAPVGAPSSLPPLAQDASAPRARHLLPRRPRGAYFQFSTSRVK